MPDDKKKSYGPDNPHPGFLKDKANNTIDASARNKSINEYIMQAKAQVERPMQEQKAMADLMAPPEQMVSPSAPYTEFFGPGGEVPASERYFKPSYGVVPFVLKKLGIGSESAPPPPSMAQVPEQSIPIVDSIIDVMQESNLSPPKDEEEAGRMGADLGGEAAVRLLGAVPDAQGGQPQQPKPLGPDLGQTGLIDPTVWGGWNEPNKFTQRTAGQSADKAGDAIAKKQGGDYWGDNLWNVIQIALSAAIGGIAMHNGAIGMMPVATALAAHGRKGIGDWYSKKRHERELEIEKLIDPQKAAMAWAESVPELYVQSMLAGEDYEADFIPKMRQAYAALTAGAGAYAPFETIVPAAPSTAMMKAWQEREMIRQADEADKAWKGGSEEVAATLVKEELEQPGGGRLAEVLTQIEAGEEPNYDAVSLFLQAASEKRGQNDPIAGKIAGSSLELAKMALAEYQKEGPDLFGVDGGKKLDNGKQDPEQDVLIDDDEMAEYPMFDSLRGKKMKYSELKPLAEKAILDNLEFREDPFAPGKVSLHIRKLKPYKGEYTPFKGYMGGPSLGLMEEGMRGEWIQFIETPVDMPTEINSKTAKKKQLFEAALKNRKLLTEEGRQFLDRLKQEASN